MKDESSDFFKSLCLFMCWAGLVVLTLLLLVTFVPHECGNAIKGYKEEIGARVYINDELAGVIEKYKDYGDGIIASRLCTWFEKGDLMVVEKAGYQTYTATLDPYVNDSGPPDYVVNIELVPTAQREKSKVPF